MLELQQPLVNRLKQMRVHVDLPDGDTVVLRNVPVHPSSFTKSHTNLLVKRAHPGAPFVLGVDEDLDYRGADADLLRAFAGGVRRQGWRVLLLTEPPPAEAQQMVDLALRMLGTDGKEPTAPPKPAKASPERRLLATVGTNLTQLATAGRGPITVGNEDETTELVATVLRWGQARLPLVIGESGVGKTNLLHAAAQKLHECRPQMSLVLVDVATLLAGTIFDAERENLLATLFKEAIAQPETIVALEHMELCFFSYGPLQLTQALDAGAKLIGTTLAGHLPRFQVHPVIRRLHVMELAEPDEIEVCRILQALREPIAAHHRLDIDATCLRGCVQSAAELPGHFPAKAIDLLDAAASRAAVSGASVLGMDDIYNAASLCQRDE
jgi:AAA lid domain-containing protein